jgi:D-glycero-D-manno-heptose 1,7-bisphosphate phosphatase
MRAIFLDRDGVICKNRPDHVKSWAEFEFLPGVKYALANLSQLDLPVVVVTNQGLINRGLATAEVVEEIHRRMTAELTAAGARIDRVYTCPHRPDEGCDCRKPQPGMLLQAARELSIDLAGSYLVGDALTDLLAGSRVGCQTYLVLTGRGPGQLWPAFQALGGGFTIVRDLKDAVNHILNSEQSIRFNLTHDTLSVSTSFK